MLRKTVFIIIWALAVLTGCGKKEDAGAAQTASTAAQEQEEVVVSGHGREQSNVYSTAKDSRDEKPADTDAARERILSVLNEEYADALQPYLENMRAIEVPALEGVNNGHTSAVADIESGRAQDLGQILEDIFGPARSADGSAPPFDGDSIVEEMLRSGTDHQYRTSMPLERQGLLTLEVYTSKNEGFTRLYLYVY